MQRLIEKHFVRENSTLEDFEAYLRIETGGAIMVEDGPIIESPCGRYWKINVWSGDGHPGPMRKPEVNLFPDLPALGSIGERPEYDGAPDESIGWTPGVATGEGFEKQ